MYRFEYNMSKALTGAIDLRVENEIKIFKNDELTPESTVILTDDNTFMFRFQKWCENWLDDRKITDVEYQVFVRIH